MEEGPELDVVVFGGSGFAGRLVAANLADAAPTGLRIGLAGRSQERLAAVRERLGGAAAEWPMVVADLGIRVGGGHGRDRRRRGAVPPRQHRGRRRSATTRLLWRSTQPRRTGPRYLTRIAAAGQPGYTASSLLLGEGALCLALDDDRLLSAAGVLTPATALGSTLAERLRAAGVDITSRRPA